MNSELFHWNKIYDLIEDGYNYQETDPDDKTYKHNHIHNFEFRKILESGEYIGLINSKYDFKYLQLLESAFIDYEYFIIAVKLGTISLNESIIRKRVELLYDYLTKLHTKEQFKDDNPYKELDELIYVRLYTSKDMFTVSSKNKIDSPKNKSANDHYCLFYDLIENLYRDLRGMLPTTELKIPLNSVGYLENHSTIPKPKVVLHDDEFEKLFIKLSESGFIRLNRTRFERIIGGSKTTDRIIWYGDKQKDLANLICALHSYGKIRKSKQPTEKFEFPPYDKMRIQFILSEGRKPIKKMTLDKNEIIVAKELYKEIFQ